MTETNPRQVSVERLINAPAAEIFAIVSSPEGHVAMDGSGTVKASKSGPTQLGLGDKFNMAMKLGVPYRMSSTVLEFEPDRLIAWAHFGKHRWRFELEPQGDDATLVRHTFDWSRAISTKFIELAGYPKKHPASMEKTLARLADLVE